MNQSNVLATTRKLSQENVGVNLQDFEWAKPFQMTPKAQATKEKNR